MNPADERCGAKRSHEGDWRVTAWGENLTNYNYKAGGNALISTTETVSYQWNIPRTYGVELAYTW